MKSVLLVVKSKKMENLGVMYLSAIIKRCKHDCHIIELGQLEDGMKAYSPDIIGYSIMTGDEERFRDANFKYVVSRYSLKGKKCPKIIVGGPDPTFHPNIYEKWTNVVVQGEAEGWAAKEFGDTMWEAFPFLDDIPWPDRTDFPNMPIRDFISSRGCPYKCTYCYNDRWNVLFPHTKNVRTRNANDVVREIAHVAPKFAYFQDSCFGVSMQWLREFTKQYCGVNIPYHCHLRPEQVVEERVLLLKDSGCYSTRIALETASMELRKVIGRERMKLDDVSRAARLLKKWDIKLMIQNMIGLPTSTIEDDLETLEFNISCQSSYGWVSIFQPYPGTILGDKCKKNKWYKGDYSDISDSFFDTSPLNFKPEHIEQLEVLQKVFAPCVEHKYMPKAEELTHENFPKLIHAIFRKVGDKRLYGGVI